MLETRCQEARFTPAYRTTHWSGHVSLNRNLTIMKLRSDPLCPLCKEDSDWFAHYVL